MVINQTASVYLFIILLYYNTAWPSVFRYDLGLPKWYDSDAKLKALQVCLPNTKVKRLVPSWSQHLTRLNIRYDRDTLSMARW